MPDEFFEHSDSRGDAWFNHPWKKLWSWSEIGGNYLSNNQIYFIILVKLIINASYWLSCALAGLERYRFCYLVQPLHFESALAVTSKVSVRIFLERSLPSPLARVDSVPRLNLGCV